MKTKGEYTIRFSGLKDGKHEFSFQLTDTFFEQLDYSIIEGGNLNAEVSFMKTPTMLELDFTIRGLVNVMCDRCTDHFDLSVEGTENLIYKFSDTHLEDEKVRILNPAAIEVNIEQPLYEFSAILLPNRKVHPEGECNQEMLDRMDDYLIVEKEEIESTEGEKEETDETAEEIDPRWAELKKLKKK